jgi:hypothetical protein
VIFANIEVRGRPESPLKIKGVSRDKSVIFEDAGFEYRGFRPAL